jgi:hypothetical protein
MPRNGHRRRYLQAHGREHGQPARRRNRSRGTQVLRTPPEILTAFLKAWDEIAVEESAKNPVFKKVYDSQRDYTSKVVPTKRYLYPPYSFAANHYWPQEKAKPAKAPPKAAAPAKK